MNRFSSILFVSIHAHRASYIIHSETIFISSVLIDSNSSFIIVKQCLVVIGFAMNACCMTVLATVWESSLCLNFDRGYNVYTHWFVSTFCVYS